MREKLVKGLIKVSIACFGLAGALLIAKKRGVI